MRDASRFPQLILRLALGIGFLLPVLDRLGVFGPPGAPNVAWGDWPHFINYTHTLMPFLSRPLANIMGLVATIGEGIFGICLILGFKTRLAAMGSALLTGFFAVFMIISLGIAAPFNYPVFVFTGGAWVLACLPAYKWSLDELLAVKH